SGRIQSLDFAPAPLNSKSRNRPSADQSAGTFEPSEWKRSRSSPTPLEDFSKRSSSSLLGPDPKAMRLPSGDQTGSHVGLSPAVSLATTPRVTSACQSSRPPTSKFTTSITTCFSSGERLTPRQDPGESSDASGLPLRSNQTSFAGPVRLPLPKARTPV